MKRLFLKILLISVFSVKAWNCDVSAVKDSINPEKSIEVFPKWENCKEADGSKEGFKICLQIYLRENIQNPQNIDGRANAKIRISPEGRAEILDVSASDSNLKDEVYRLAAQMPRFIPAQSGGKAVSFEFLLPLSFRKEENTLVKRPKIFSRPDVFPKWDSNISDRKSEEAFDEELRKRIFEDIPSTNSQGKPQRIYLLVRITDEGYLQVNESFCEEPQLLEKVERNIRKMPRLIPAKVKRNNVHFENLYSYWGADEFCEKIGEGDVAQYPVLGDCDKSLGKNGTMEAFQKCCNSNVQQKFIYPAEAIENDIQGTVYVVFSINEQGKLEVKSLLGGEEILKVGALYVMQQISVVQPAKLNGKPTTLYFTYPIVFKLK